MLLKQCLEGNLWHQMFIFFLSKVSFPGPLVVKEPTCQCRDLRDTSSVPGSGTPWSSSPGGGTGHPLQYSCLENLMVRGAQWGTVHSVTESDMTEATWHISQHRCLYQKIKIKNNFLFYQKIKKLLNEGKNIHLKNQKKKMKLSAKQEGRELAMLEQKSTK